MADNKRLRVSKACDSCRRKKVKCDAIHPLCTNCETFNYECKRQNIFFVSTCFEKEKKFRPLVMHGGLGLLALD
ncbi:hypothetical protein BC939DRAFT_137120 [Gamsiella multidivaricata]|uniref:uncharacterized protein n=1 Tax=Gamsiella multidivaricata TaxID=101098 RepID=UPI002220D146|nr:uncharacterized protein BC939DRAFT_137120 [Gamsiella multidivaricata]KAI7824605.1 hypothetical protein BC939DRAFT_137120 [Gamsiella multidivaricata]